MPRQHAKKETKVRLNLEIPEKVRERIRRLQDLSEAETMTEVIRRALAAYDVLLNHYELGGTVILRHSGDNEEILRIV